MSTKHEYHTEIGPGCSSALSELRVLHRHHQLIWILARREISARYKQSVLGPSLLIIQPLIITLIFTFLFGVVAQVDTGGVDYTVFAFAGVLPWTFFQRCTTSAGTSLTTYGGVLSKVYFPRVVAPLTALVVASVDFLASVLVFVVVAAFFGYYPTWNWLFLPLIMLYGGLVSLSLALWITSLNLDYRDVQHMLPHALQALMYLSPVAYPLSAVPENLRFLYDLNPLVAYVSVARWILLDQPLVSPGTILASLSISSLLLIGGLLYFSKTVQTFADRL